MFPREDHPTDLAAVVIAIVTRVSFTLRLVVADPFLVMIVHPIATVVNPPIAIMPRAMLVVVADNHRCGLVVRRSRRGAVAAVAGVVRFEAALKREHPNRQRSRPDDADNLA